jgi:hypothetical protein
VLDASGQALIYVYARETPNEANIAGVLTFDEARRTLDKQENPAAGMGFQPGSLVVCALWSASLMGGEPP